jgi:YD repeat-containing protein
MGTYTYNPLYGMTSGCDAGNRITYYEYDAKGKLYLTRDLDGKILKQYDYQYQVPVQQ